MSLFGKVTVLGALALGGLATYALIFQDGARALADDCGSFKDGAESGDPGQGLPPEAPEDVEELVEDAPDSLVERRLLIPVRGVSREDLLDTFDQQRGDHARHEAIDIMAKAGTPVCAVDDGRIEKLFRSDKGGNTIYQFGPAAKYCYYYAHLDRYAPGLEEGMRVRKGDLIGYVGSTGNASAAAPHLHFGITRLGPEKRWWGGDAINPFPILVAGKDAPAH